MSSQNTLLINFSPVQPIFTSNILIDSSQQVEQNETSKFSNFHSRGASGDIFLEKSPQQ
jgi:hypothetical protein